MKRTATVRVLTLFALVALFAATAHAGAHPKPGLTRGRVDRAQLQKPNRRGKPPEALVLTPGEGGAGDGQSQRSRPAPGANVERRDSHDGLARVEGVWTADRLSHERGERAFYQVGFYEGLQAAFRDAAVGRWDYRGGRRHGSLDPEAASYGTNLGRIAAADTAREAAARRVEAQFLDLRSEPVRDSRPVPATSYRGGTPDLERPTLRAVFREYPVPNVITPTPRFLIGWEYDGWRLFECPAYGQFYDAWTDPGEAFSFWVDQRARSTIWRRDLSDVEQRRFRQIFESAFADRLARLYDRRLLPAHGDGFDDGWGYGTFVRGELEYRKGYRDGFRLAVGDAANAAFERDFPRRFTAAYDEHFDAWSGSPRPAIGQARLFDGDDDGIFQPGEALRVEFELINYGGAGGTLPVRLEGDALEAAAVDRITVPRRSFRQAVLPLSARLRSDLSAPSSTVLELSAADQTVALPLDVEFPLRLVRQTLRSQRDNLAGEVRIEVAVENRSRRSRPGTVSLTTSGFADKRSFEALGAGERVTVRFDVRGLHSMDLISGRVSVDLRLGDGEIEQDRLIHHLTEVARDLGNRDLLLYIRDLALRGGATRAEIAAARRWLLARLREDWGAAARGRGNPYKYDYRRQTSRSALGDLVQSYLLVQDHVVQPDVYAGLSAEIMTLAGVLPGIHPFLRKYARRLASRLP